MRVSDTTMVVSAIFHLAEKNGTDKVSPGELTSFLASEFSLTIPLHAVSEIIADLGLVTQVHHNTRYIVWNSASMSQLKNTYATNFSNSTTINKSVYSGGQKVESTMLNDKRTIN